MKLIDAVLMITAALTGSAFAQENLVEILDCHDGVYDGGKSFKLFKDQVTQKTIAQWIQRDQIAGDQVLAQFSANRLDGCPAGSFTPCIRFNGSSAEGGDFQFFMNLDAYGKDLGSSVSLRLNRGEDREETALRCSDWPFYPAQK